MTSKDKLKKGGTKTDNANYVLALAGNPNTGKSTVFNYLTGLRQHTGNWPGKTVARAEGSYTYHGAKYKIVDLPGTYSLLSRSEDEEIARNFILFGRPDVTVIVTDATRLERNLNLTLQILEITDKAVMVLNLMDEARSHGVELDADALSARLGIPVVKAAAREGEGMEELMQLIEGVAKGDIQCKPRRSSSLTGIHAEAVEKVQKEIEEIYPDLPNARWVAVRLLEGDTRIIQAVKTGEWIDDEVLLQ